MRTPTRVGVALFVALALQLVPWTQVTRDTGALLAAAVGIGLALIAGASGRRLRLPAWLLPVLQLLLVCAWALGVVAWAGGPRALSRAPVLAGEGITFLRGSAAPLNPHLGVTLLLIVLVGALAVLADHLAVTCRMPAWGIGPLLVMYLVPAVGLTTPMMFTEFVLFAVGVLLLLWAAAPTAWRPGARLASFATVAVVGALALGVAWGAAQLVPDFETRRSNDPLQMSDPSLDLKRNLVQGSDDVILSYTTDHPEGTYLKLATLPAFSASGFGLADVRVATGRMPAPAGSPSGTPRTTQVQIGSFSSEWLPVPYAPTAVEAPGEWGFALDTLDVMALAGPERTTASQDVAYTVRSLDVTPSASAVAGASASGGTQREVTAALPREVPARVRALAHEVTGGHTTAGAKAQALETYLRSDRFTYSTAPSAGVGDGIATIDDFLFRSRRGYCEQFAGAMAIMAREVGIPTRMAVGFVPGTRNGDAWDVTERDLHTWPELWLDGLGWVAFEPTPSRGDTGPGEPTPEPTGDEVPTPGPESATPTPTPEPEPTAPAEVDESEPAPAPVPGLASVLPWVLAGLFVLALVAGALRAPVWLRRRRRTTRLAGTGDARVDTLSAWDEVREVAGDLRLEWPDGSPRHAAERFAAHLGGDAAATDALARLAAASERALYDRSDAYDLPGTWRDEVTTISDALRSTAEAQRRSTPRRAR